MDAQVSKTQWLKAWCTCALGSPHWLLVVVTIAWCDVENNDIIAILVVIIAIAWRTIWNSSCANAPGAPSRQIVLLQPFSCCFCCRCAAQHRNSMRLRMRPCCCCRRATQCWNGMRLRTRPCCCHHHATRHWNGVRLRTRPCYCRCCVKQGWKWHALAHKAMSC